MAFFNLAMSDRTKAYGSQGRSDEVFVALYDIGNVTNSLTLAIRIGGDVMEKLKWERNDFVWVSEGDGADSGFVSIEKTKDAGGRRLVTPNGVRRDSRAARLYILAAHFGKYTMPKSHVRGIKVDYQVSGKSLIIKLPDWAKPKSKTRTR